MPAMRPAFFAASGDALSLASQVSISSAVLFISSAWKLSTSCPSRASATAGSTRSFHGSEPYFLCAMANPATLPGMPAARGPSWLSIVGLPSLSRYMSRLALPGAISRKSSAVDFPSGNWMIMKPPPPMLPAVGWVTPRARPTATAASTALPPFSSTALPIAVACFSALVTAPRLPVATSVADAAGAGAFASAAGASVAV